MAPAQEASRPCCRGCCPRSTADFHSPQSLFPAAVGCGEDPDDRRLEANHDVVAPQELAVALVVVEWPGAGAAEFSAQSQRTSLRQVTFLLGFQFRPSVTSFHLEPGSMNVGLSRWSPQPR